MLLQPTSPLRTTLDIDKSIEKCEKYNAFSVVSVNKFQKSINLMFNLRKKNNVNFFKKFSKKI